MEKKDKNNIIYLSDYEKEREIRAYLNLLRIGKIIEVINIDATGLVDIYEFGMDHLGIVFGFDFVTFEEKPQIYPINVDMDNDEFFTEDEPGIYVTHLEPIPASKYDEYYKLVEKNLDTFKQIEKNYFDNFLNDIQIEYSKDSSRLREDDEKYYVPDECNIIDFKKGVKAVEARKRELNKEYIKNLVKGNKRW